MTLKQFTHFPVDIDRWFTTEVNFPSVAAAMKCKEALEELAGQIVTMTPAETGVHFEGAFDLGSFDEDGSFGLSKTIAAYTNTTTEMLVKMIYIESSGYFGGQVIRYSLETGQELDCIGLNEVFENNDFPLRKQED